MKSQSRELPTITIEGTEFLVDLEENALVEVQNRENKIPFDKMRNEGPHFLFLYDISKKGLAGNKYKADNVRTIKVPSLERLDPVGYAIKHRLPADTFLERSPSTRKIKRS